MVHSSKTISGGRRHKHSLASEEYGRAIHARVQALRPLGDPRLKTCPVSFSALCPASSPCGLCEKTSIPELILLAPSPCSDIARHKPGWIQFDGLQVDHILPKSRGGSSEANNLALACRRCNCGRCNRSFEYLARRKAFLEDGGAVANG